MTQSKTKQIELVCKLDPSYEDRREELSTMTMLEILNIKMNVKKNIKIKSDNQESEDQERSLVYILGCVN